MFKIMVRYLIVGLSVILSGCSLFVIGDNVVIVTGEVDKKCTLTFKPLGLEKMQKYYTRDIEGVFSEDFTLSPKSSKYTLNITCSGSSVYSEIVKIPEQSDKLKLGRLVI